MESPKPLESNLISKLTKLATKKRIEFWDIRVASSSGTLLEFTNGKNKEVSYSNIKGAGIRAFINGGWGFSVKQNISDSSIIEGLNEAIKLALFAERYSKFKFKIKEYDLIRDKYTTKLKTPLKDVDIEQKIDFALQIEKDAHDFDPRVINTNSLYTDGIINSLLINSFGSSIEQSISILKIGIKSAKKAIKLLSAKPVKGGKFTVIMDPKLTGVFIHEAFGHACEADLVIAKESILEEKLGEKVASENISIIDDPTPSDMALFGSYKFDDEGIAAKPVQLVENGVLKTYLHDLESASRMNVSPNGHGRASSYSSKPQARMGVTYLKEHDWKLNEMIEDTKNGVLCENWKYGYTNPATGNFQFKTRNCYKIENGEKTELMRDVGLSGLILEILNRVSAIGNKIEYSDGVCGKGGQRVRNCTGGPYLRVEDVVMGGLQ